MFLLPSQFYKFLALLFLVLVLLAPPVTRHSVLSAQDDQTPTIEENTPPSASESDSIGVYDDIQGLSRQAEYLIGGVVSVVVIVLVLGIGYYRAHVAGLWGALDKDIDAIVNDIKTLDRIEEQFFLLPPALQNIVQVSVRVLVVVAPFIPATPTDGNTAEQIKRRRELILSGFLVKVTDGKPNT